MILTSQFLVATEKVYKVCETDFLGVRPRAICKNGLNISIQAGRGYNCFPNDDDGPYTHVELGFPIYSPSLQTVFNFLSSIGAPFSECLIIHYAEHKDDPQNTIYKNVPVPVVDKLLAKYGGIVAWEEFDGENLTIQPITDKNPLKLSLISG